MSSQLAFGNCSNNASIRNWNETLSLVHDRCTSRKWKRTNIFSLALKAFHVCSDAEYPNKSIACSVPLILERGQDFWAHYDDNNVMMILKPLWVNSNSCEQLVLTSLGLSANEEHSLHFHEFFTSRTRTITTTIRRLRQIPLWTMYMIFCTILSLCIKIN